ncbi:TPA: hypothetical protein TVK14_001472 [Streptococcus equi subsp. zooepidemicus]|nr:hypothetical protein [Streptococcus equi subsp. zooepidemicus]
MKFKRAIPKKEFNSDKIIGTTIFVLDKDGNEQSVAIYKQLAELPILSKLKPFDDISFEGLEGYIRGVSKKETDFVTLKLVLRADNVKVERGV